jgi:single-strand DNA-binding protein
MYQKTVVVGHLGRDPELRYTPSGVPVCSFSIATTKKWTDGDGKPKEETTWFRVSTWRKTAEVCAQYLQKGRLVLVEGDVKASAWTDKEGKARAGLELTATNVKFLGGRNDGDGEGAGNAGSSDGYRGSEGDGGGFNADDDDIPF